MRQAGVETGLPIEEMIFWGAVGHALVLQDCIRETTTRLVALVDNNPDVNPAIDSVPCLVGREGLSAWLEHRSATHPLGFLVAIGGERGKERTAIHDELAEMGLVPLTAIHPTAFVAESATVGDGSQICAQAAVCVQAVLGRSVIVNTGATVDHETVLGDGVHVCPGAHIAGSVTVERFATVGTGATVIPRVTIGEGAVVGAGAVVIADVAPHAVVVGNPVQSTGNRENY